MEERISRTYVFPADLIDRLTQAAAELRVYPSHLVCYLVARGLDQIDAGELVVPTRPARQNIIMEVQR